MTRRIAVAAVAVTALVASACTKISTQSGHWAAGPGNPWTIHGVLRVAALDEPDNLNPMVGNQQAEVDLSLLWGAYLFRFDDKNQWVPEMAVRVPSIANGDVSKDGRHIVYHLRAGVKWQDGAPFSADDVIYSWRQVMNPQNNVPSRTGYEDVVSIAKRDALTIVVNLRRPYAPFLSAFFSMGATPICILPEHVLSRYANVNRVPYNNLPVGTGPFQVARYDHGSMIKLVANPNYFRGAPRLREIDWHFIPDSNTILTQLRTHEIDAVFAMPYEYYPAAQRLSGVRLYLTPLTAYDQIAFNLQNPELADITVRRALAYAVDRQSILDKVYHDVPMLGDSDQPAFLWAHSDAVTRYPYEPALAQQMLQNDGWNKAPDGYRYKQGRRLRIQFATTPSGSGSENVLIQQGWQRIGVDTSIKVVAGPIFFATYGAGGTLQSGKFDAAYLGWFNGADPDDSTQFMCDQFPPNGQNMYHFCSRRLDEAERTALVSYDLPARKAAYAHIQEILTQQEPTVFMFFVRRLSILNADFRNFKPAHAVGVMWNPWEWEI